MSLWPFGKRDPSTERRPEVSPAVQAANRARLERIVTEDRLWSQEFADGFAEHLRARGFSFEEIQDILQDTRILAWGSLASYRYRGDCQPRTFLYQIGRRRAADVIAGNVRERKHTVPIEALTNEEFEGKRPADEIIAGPSIVPIDKQIILREQHTAWMSALGEICHLATQLPNENYRKILPILSDPVQRDKIEGQTYKALAYLTHLPEKQIPENVKRAKKQGMKIVNQVASAHNLGADFVAWVEERWEVQGRKG